MNRALLLAAALVSGCGEPASGSAPAPLSARSDRAAMEAIVAACDGGARRRDCEPARQALAGVRREHRLATYRKAL